MLETDVVYLEWAQFLVNTSMISLCH